MDEHARYRALRFLAGAAGGGAIALAAITLESWAWPYGWLRVLIAIWAVPPVLVGIAAGAYVAEQLSQMQPRTRRAASWWWSSRHMDRAARGVKFR